MTTDRTEFSSFGAIVVLLLLSTFPLSLWWKALTMQTTVEMITKLGRPVDPLIFWAFSGLLALTGIWAVGKTLDAVNLDRKGRLLVSIFLGVFFFSSCGAVAMIAISQDQLMKGIASP